MTQAQGERDKRERTIITRLNDASISIVAGMTLAIVMGIFTLEFKRAKDDGRNAEWRKKIDRHCELSKAESLQDRKEIYEKIAEKTVDRFTRADYDSESRLMKYEMQEQCACRDNSVRIKELEKEIASILERIHKNIKDIE